MTIQEYLNAKYGNRSIGLLSAEAKAFGIPYPLKSGWIQRWGGVEITPQMEERLVYLLKQKNQRAPRSSANRGLGVLYENAAMEFTDGEGTRHLFSILQE